MHLLRPFLSFLPEVQSADRKVPFREKVIYTVISLFIFLVCIKQEGKKKEGLRRKGCAFDKSAALLE